MVRDTDATWRQLLQSRVGTFELNDLLRIKKGNSVMERQRVPAFYKEIVTSFQKLCSSPVDSAYVVRCQSLWHSDDLKINNKPIFIKSMYRLGIKIIDDITDATGNLMNVDQLKQKYPGLQTHFLTVQSLKHAIPSAWKELIRQNPACKVTSKEKNEMVVTIGEKCMSLAHFRSFHFYNKLIEKVVPTAVAKWESYGIQPRSWKTIFEIPYKCTKSTRLQSLHYRIVNM